MTIRPDLPKSGITTEEAERRVRRIATSGTTVARETMRLRNAFGVAVERTARANRQVGRGALLMPERRRPCVRWVPYASVLVGSAPTGASAGTAGVTSRACLPAY